MKTYFLYGTSLPQYAERTLLMRIFQEFGSITKIYISPDLLWFKVYFNTKEEAEAAAASLNDQQPYYMQLCVKSEEQKSKKTKQNSISKAAVSNNSNMSFTDYDDFYTDAGPDYYNIHGMCVPTLSADDGTIYVPLKEVKKVGFELFEDSNIPKNINFKKQALEEFKVYLNIKARKYISKMKYQIPEKVIEETKNEIINKYVSNGPSRNASSRLLDNSVSIPALSDIKIDEQKVIKNLATRNKSPQTEIHKPLRKPTTVNDDKSPNIQSGKSNVKNWQQTNQNANKTNIMSNKINTENVTPKIQGNPMQESLPVNKVIEPTVRRIELPLNEPIQVVVSFTESQKKCWVYKKEDNDKLEDLLIKTNSEVLRKRKIKPSIGEVCASTFCDDTWYRSLILQVTPAIKVQYIDFGNCNVDVINEVRELSAKTVSEPALAVHANFITPPKTELQDNVELNIIARKKNDDGSYEVEEVIENQQASELHQLNVVPAGKIILNSNNRHSVPKTENTTDKSKSFNGISPETSTESKSNSSQSFNSSQTDKLPVCSPNLTFKERLQKMTDAKKETKSLNPIRKSVVDITGDDTGLIQFVQKLGEDSCICFIIPNNFIGEVSSLDEITPDPKSTTNFIPKIGDTVSAYQEDTQTWYRGTVLNVNNNEYTIALIDYGTIISTKIVGQLDKTFMDIPEFTCVCYGKVECVNFLEKANGEVFFTSTERNKIKLNFNNVFYNITCTRWNPFETSKLSKSTDENITFTVAPAVKELKDKEKILPITLDDGKLFVRNKETNVLLSKIKNDISEYKASPLVKKPVINQLVLCRHDTQPILCRGIIKSLHNDFANVMFIDFGFVEMIPMKSIMSISESLAKQDSTLIPIVLKGFENGEYSEAAIECIEHYCIEAKKFIAEKCSNNVFDLIINEPPNGEMRLSSKLKSLSASNNRLMYRSMPKWEIEADNTTVDLLCVSVEKDGTIVFIPNDNLKNELCDLNDKIIDYTKTKNERYCPEIDELCLAKYDEEWYRAKVQKVNKALEQYEVYYIDYGNVTTVPSIDIRQIPKDFIKLPALAIVCCPTEILHNHSEVTEEVLEIVKNELDIGNSYIVQIIGKIDNNMYEVTIPSLSPKLQEIFSF